MMQMPLAAIKHAQQEYPKESCGLIVDGMYYPCKNSASTPDEHFIIDKADYIKALEFGEIEAVIHSHPDYPPIPSDADKASCESTDVPWGIIGLTKDANDEFAVFVNWFSPSGFMAPLIGRKYLWGVFDCLSIVLDYYKRELDINLGEFERPDESWCKQSDDIYTREMIKNGFEKIDKPEKNGDVIIMQIRSMVPNHAAIFLENGILSTEPEHYPAPMSILHHLQGNLSRRDIYGGYWAEKTVSIWRLKNSKQSGSTESLGQSSGESID
jgi:proteasome lid subunit RPN8/RPN11